MTIPLDRPASPEKVFLWLMHRFAEVFEDHAILEGGMALRLIDSPRSTTDIDYVFVPFTSKKDIRKKIESVLNEIEGADIHVEMHSKMLRAEIHVDSIAIQLEAHVALECDTIPMATGGFARSLGQPSRIVRIMRLDCALAHKLAAWNERRLARDLYDCYFLASRLGEMPDLRVLDARLAKIDSKLPKLKTVRTMSRDELASELRAAADGISQEGLSKELTGILPHEELTGLAPRVSAALRKIVEWLDLQST